MKKKVTSQKVLKAEEAKTQWICHSDSGIRHWHQAEVAGYAAALVFFTPSDDDSGVAHALEHMVLRGCEAFPESRHFFNLRCRLNLDEFNATTQPETTRFHLSGDNLDAAIEGLHFFVESGLSPLLDQTAFAGEVWHTDIDGKTRGALYQEMCGYAAQPTFADAVSLVCDCHCRPALYGGMPDTIPQLTLNHLRHYHRRFYRPDNVLLLTRGDWPLDDIGKLLSRAVTRWQRRTDSEKYRDVPEPIFHYRPKRRQVIDVPTSPVWAAILATELTRDHHQIQLRQRQLQLQAVTSDFLCWPRLRFSYCDKNEQNCHEKNNHEEENNEKENNEKENIAVVALQPWLEGIARRIPVRRQQWQWRYFAMQQGSLVARRWGDSLQRLYQCAARDPDIPNVLRSTTINLAPLCRDTTPAKHGEFLADCPAITRLAIICRVPDRYHNQSVAAWLVHCQQATLRWTWLQSQPVISSQAEWCLHGAHVQVYFVDLELSFADTLLSFWCQTLISAAPEFIQRSIQVTDAGLIAFVKDENGTADYCVPAKTEQRLSVSYHQTTQGWRLCSTFPPETTDSEVCLLAQGIMMSPEVQDRRLEGQCYTLAANLDLMHRQLNIEGIWDQSPIDSISAIRQSLRSLVDEVLVDKAQIIGIGSGAEGLWRTHYNKFSPAYHSALLQASGCETQPDFYHPDVTRLTDIARQMLKALDNVEMS